MLAVTLHLVFGAPPFHAVVFSMPVVWLRCIRGLPSRTRRRILRFSLPFAAIAATVAFTAVLLFMTRSEPAEIDYSQIPLAVYAVMSLGATFDLMARWLTRSPGRVGGRLAGTVLVGVLLVVVAVPMTFCFINVHRLKSARSPRFSAPGLAAADFDFASHDGLVLRGTLLHHREPRPGIVFCHGVSSNRAEFMAHAEELAEIGYTVLVFDARGHGQSEGRRVSFGHLEKLDLSEAVTCLLRRRDVVRGERVVLAGSSMGAATALLTACDDRRVAAVVSEAAFANLEDMARLRFEALPETIGRGLVAVVSWCSWLQVGVTLDQVDPERALRECDREFPVLLLHGNRDETIPLEHARRLHRSRPGMQLEIFEHTGHSACLGSRPVLYRRLVTEFLHRHHP